MIRRRTRTAGSAVVWAAGAYLAATGVLNIYADRFDPRIADIDYGRLQEDLLDRIRERPDDPLVLVIGSSHIASGFLPAELPEIRDAHGRRMLVFNFGRNGAHHLYHLAVLHRLEAVGVRPAAAVIEEFSCNSGARNRQFRWMGEHGRILSADLPALAGSLPQWRLWSEYLAERLAAAHAFRLNLQYLVRRELATPDMSRSWDFYGGRRESLGGYAAEAEASAPVRAALWRSVLRNRIDPDSRLPDEFEREIRMETIRYCRERGIAVAFVLTPRSARADGLLPPAWHSAANAHLAGLARAGGVRIVDARNWVDDIDLPDGEHLLRRAASAFTARLGPELIEPLVQGRLTPGFSPIPLRPVERTLTLDWATGFSNLENYGANDLRWCEHRGELWIENTYPEPQTLRLTMGFRVGAPGIHRLTVQGPSLDKEVRVSAEETTVSWTITAPQGDHVIRFACDAPRLEAPNDTRTLVFQVTNFRMTQE